MEIKIKYEILDDNQLIEMISRDDQCAFSTLYYRYSKYIYSLAYKFLANKTLAEDILQDIYMNIWDNRQQIAYHSNFKGYLYIIIKNKVFNHLRHDKMRTAKLNDIAHNRVDSSHDNPNGERLEIVAAASKSLPQNQQRIITLKQEGYSNEEISQQMHLPINTIKTYYTRSIKSLRKIVPIILCILFCLSIVL